MWIPVTLMAATFQILRTSRQHQLAGVLTATGAGFVRYLYGAPLALSASVCWFAWFGHSLPSPTTRFWVFVVAAGVAQIAATVALLQSFRTRDFAIGTVYAKTEVIQVAVIGSLVIGEPLRPAGWLGAAICTAGVVWLASGHSIGALLRRAGDPAAILGVVAGGLFGLAAVGIRGASTALEPAGTLDRALFTLTTMLVVQTLINGAYLALRDRRELVRTISAWRVALGVGVLSFLGSTGWALAVTLENAAKVRTLGQVELLLAFAVARYRHDEHHSVAEHVAGAIVLVGVAVTTAWG